METGKKLLCEAKWIWPELNFYDLVNVFAQFRKDFFLDKVPEKAMFYITADQNYRLWVNGKYITRGPARGYQSHWPYDQVDLADVLLVGKNYISVQVYNPGISTFSYLSESCAGLLCAGDFASVQIRSNETWISKIDGAHKRNTARYSLQTNFQEHVDSRKDDRSWITATAKPRSWKNRKQPAFGSMPWYDLEERGIPQLLEKIRSPRSIVAMGNGETKAGYKKYENIVEVLHKEYTKSKWQIENISLKENQEVNISPSGKGKFNALVFDMGETVVGPSTITVEGGKSGMVVDLFFSELVENDGCPVIPDTKQIHSKLAMANRLVLSGKKIKYDFFHLIGFRYLTVSVRENESPINLKLEVTDTGYPYTMTGEFECSDANINDIWSICRRTQQVCSLDAYIDTPWREQAQWWGDARIQFWNTMAIDGDTRLFKRGIRSISGQKVPNGLTYGHAPTMAHSCILPDLSLVWIITIYDYYRQTKDIALFNEQLPRILEVLSYFEKEAKKQKGLICYDDRYWLFLDWSDLVKNGASTLYNMLYLLTLRLMAKMYGISGNEHKSKEMSKSAANLQKAIEENLFDKSSGLFCDGLDEDGKPYKIHSVHSQVFAMILDLNPQCHEQMLNHRILPFLRGEKIYAPVPSASFTTYLLSLLREKDYKKEVVDYIKRMWTPMIPYSTCPEVFDFRRGDESCSHAWSAHPLFHLMNILGGVSQDSDGWDIITFDPYFDPNLDYVKIKMPTPYGLIESNWERKDGKLSVALKLPKNVTAKILIRGMENEITDSFECYYNN